MVRERRRHSRSRSRSPARKRSRSRERRSRRSRSRDRRRSRSRDRRRSRSRSRDRRSRSRDRRRSRSRDRRRSRSRDRKRSRRSRSSSPTKKNSIPEKIKSVPITEEEADALFDPSVVDKEEAERRLEAEMQKRRERIEKWRAEKKKKELELAKEAAGKGLLTANLPKASLKAWSLENDDESDEEAKDDAKDNQGDEVDPLDAYMTGIQTEVKKINKNNIKGNKKGFKAPGDGPKKPVIIVGVAKNTASKNKGELIEQNQDALEYSSEEEGEDLRDTMASIASKGKKEIAKVNHASVEYVPFRKNFYVEVPEIANMTNEEVTTLLAEMEGIRIKGQDCPKPIKAWAHCGVSKRILEILKKCNYEKPTHIQAQAIPAVMKGRDVIGIAKTGSGKTLAFLLPLLRHVVDQPPLEPEDGPIALIMTPTRELCMQIGKECRKFAKNSLVVSCVYGGTGISEQIAELKRGAEIIVCTPGRMIDMLAANSGRVTNLRRVSFVVLDEADRMFDLGFEPQVMRIIDNVQPGRQIVMFSATFPRQVEALAKKILKTPIEIMVGGRSVVCKDVTQEVVILDETEKFLKLLEILGNYYEKGQVIIFVDKQESADSLFKDLITHSYRALVLHGGVDQIDRDTTISDFKSGRIPILVATSVAARGLDVKQLILVVNFDAPNHYEDYVHRCGRTGRAGNKGYAYTFILKDSPKFAGDVIRALEMSEQTVPEDLKKLWEDYKVQMASEGKKIKVGNFHGKGFKFDENEANFPTEKKKFEKAALGLEDSDDEDIEGDITQQIETLLNTKRIVKEVKVATIPLTGSAPTNQTGVNVVTPLPRGPKNEDKLALAKRLAKNINRQHTVSGVQSQKGVSQQAAEFVLKGAGSVVQPSVSAKTVAEQLAQKLNNKLNYQPTFERDDDDENPEEVTHQKFEEELEINEFPQQTRWRITSKETLQQISEYSEAGITVRGTYYPPGKNPPEGDRRLFLGIESTSELSVSKAKAEIIRLIREELIKLRAGGGHIRALGRYKVV